MIVLNVCHPAVLMFIKTVTMMEMHSLYLYLNTSVFY